MEDNMVKLDEILEAVKYKEAAKKKEDAMMAAISADECVLT